MKNWLFEDQPNVAVITTKNILNGITDILQVWHDEDDGMWQFLDGFDVDEKEALIVSLKEIVELDNSVLELHALPLGWVAFRNHKNEEWKTMSEDEL